MCASRMALASSLRFERAKKGSSMSKAQAMQLEKIRVSPENVLVATNVNYLGLSSDLQKDEIIAAQEQLMKKWVYLL